MPQAKTDEQKHARQAALAALQTHPSWPEFLDNARDEQETLERRILMMALSGGETGIPFNQRQVDYMRGFVNGMRWLTREPGKAERSLEKYLQQLNEEANGGSEVIE
jgi:hypothetical protein